MDWTHNTIWRDQLDLGDFVTVDFQGKGTPLAQSGSATYIQLYKFKTKRAGLTEVDGINSAKYLQIDFSNITSLEGISRLGRIKRLELGWCLKLTSDSGLAEIADHIEWLHIDTSRKFSPTIELFGLRNLKVLCLNACGPLDSLSFLKEMPGLLDFRFVDTNVLDGDLTPLIEHPSLVNAGFLDKRHYNLKSAQVKASLAGKKDKVIESVYSNSGFQTFRYKGLGRCENEA